MMLNFCILNSDYLLRTFALKFLLLQKKPPKRCMCNRICMAENEKVTRI